MSRSFVAIGTFAIAREHGLTTYDACYLELARRLGVPAVADVNQDGRVDAADIALFMAGRRSGEATRNAGVGNAVE